ncbi:MAG: hypothetical protein AAGC55_07670 [Myxococcota bacterium]
MPVTLHDVDAYLIRCQVWRLECARKLPAAPIVLGRTRAELCSTRSVRTAHALTARAKTRCRAEHALSVGVGAPPG